MSTAQPEITCKICHQLYILAGEEESNLPYLLHCGHVYCAACLNILKLPSNIIKCPECKLETGVDDEGVDGLEVDGTTVGLIYNAKLKKSRAERQKASTEKEMVDVSERAEGKDAALVKSVDVALSQAFKSREQLQSLQRSLVEGLQTQVSVDKKRLVEEISKQTDKAVHLTHKRRVTLMTQLNELDDLFPETCAVLQEVEQRQNSLEVAILKAQNLKSPLLSEYCHPEEVLEALQVALNVPTFDLSCLKQSSGVSCLLDADSLARNLKECFTISQDSVNSLPSKCVSESSNSRPTPSESNSSLNGQSPPQIPTLPLASDRLEESIPPDSVSSPNVIIEEIIEEIPTDDTDSGQRSQQVKPKPQLSGRKKMGLLPMPNTPEEKVRLFWVTVTHVVSPSHLYVRYVADKRSATQLMRKINLFCAGNKFMLSPEHLIRKGDLLCLCKGGTWCRVQVMELYPKTSEEAVRHCVAADIYKLKVFFLDIGLTRSITVMSGDGLMGLSDLLRRPDQIAQAELFHWAPQACRCSLHGIVPSQVSGWSPTCRKEIRNATGSSAVQMQVYSENRGTLMVDLRRPPMDQGNSRMPVSLREFLVFLDLAKFLCVLTPGASSCKPLQYYPPILPKPKMEYCALVSHINTPSDFYIQLTENMEFPLLASKLQAYYGSSPEGFSLLLHSPILQQACVALFEDKVWYRSVVVGLHDGQMAEVFSVDIGCKKLVPLGHLRIIKDEFLSLPAMAVWCKLVDIECDEDGWSAACVSRFRGLAEKTLVTIVPEKLSGRQEPLPICMFEGEDEGRKRSISHILTEDKLAKRPKGLPPVPPELTQWDPPLETMDPEPIITDTVVSTQRSVPTEVSLPTCQKDIKVRVTHVISPASIFAQIVQNTRNFDRLKECLRKEFARSVPVQMDFKPGTACAALIEGVWERGAVVQAVSPIMLEVRRCDFGNIVEVHRDHLRPLPQELIGSFVIECRLSGIRPAGGAKWSATSCDLISFYLNGAVAFMTIKDPLPSHPLGVDLFCSNRAGQNVSMADFLVSEGLALPDRKSKSSSVQTAFEPKFFEPLPALELTNNECVPPLEQAFASTSECDVTPIVSSEPTNTPPSTQSYPPPELPTILGITSMSITAIGDDGVIYAMTSQAENDLEQLKRRLKHLMKATPQPSHPNWRHVEGCIIRGSDMYLHRGRIVEVFGGQVKVQYVDLGVVENIAMCHVYPMVVCEDVPQLCLPLQLHKGKPVGKDWHPDAIALMKEVMLGRQLSIEIMELPDDPRECVSVEVHFDGMSLTRILGAHHPSCISLASMDQEEDQASSPLIDLDDWDFNTKGLMVAPLVLKAFVDPPLPKVGKRFPVKIKHLCTPNKIYLRLIRRQMGGATLEEVLECVNNSVDTLTPLKDAPIGGPCLAEYSDGRFYRAELIGFVSISPDIKMLIRHVDFGSDDTVPIDKLRSLPECLVDFQRQAVCVRLAGFKPPESCAEANRLPYAPEWSVKALLEMISLLQQKGIYHAQLAAEEKEKVAYLYSPDGTLVHHSLVQRGLAVYV